MPQALRYYRVAIIGSASPFLTYRASFGCKKGDVVSVPLRQHAKRAVVVDEVGKPPFQTQAILEVHSEHFAPWQMESAKFISEYYFSTFGEAIGLFAPFQNDSVPPPAYALKHLPKLSKAQKNAYEALLTKKRALLYGVTGSGKTEVLIALMAQMLKEGKSCIFLMPEISLTPQMGKRLKGYFGDRIAIWHSKITKKKKTQILQDIASGKISIVAGARSALFVPLANVGLIVVDEEHEDSYKSQTRPRYHARDLAIYLAKKRRARVVLASATPSVSSYHRFESVRLDHPYIQAMKRFRFVGGEGVNAVIVYAIRECVEEGGQALVFVPTRGNFKYLYCPACGKTHMCPYCSVGMALHRKRRALVCHYCNFSEPIVEVCSACGHTPLLQERIGTQEVAELLQEAIGSLRIERFDKDSITTANKLAKALKRIAQKEADVVVGTQMIAKGHDYDSITLSIIMGLDRVAGMGDYRARERAIGLLFQIAGRSGRAKDSEVIIQTADPKFFEPYLRDYTLFLQEELLFREIAHYPPFAHLARVLIAHKDDTKGYALMQEAYGHLRRFKNVEIVGYGRAPIEKIAGKFRYTILLRAKERKPLLQALHGLKDKKVEIDMDPVEFF